MDQVDREETRLKVDLFLENLVHLRYNIHKSYYSRYAR